MGAVAPITITGTITDMAIPNKSRGVRIAPVYISARILVVLLGLGAVAWGCSVLPLFRQQAPLNRVATELLGGRAFKLQTLSDQAQQAAPNMRSSFCSPTELHNWVVVRAAILEKAIATGREALVKSAYTALFKLARTAASCSPANSYVWLTLFRLDAGKNGLTPQNANYLRLSYAVGPNEGWIAFWRVQFALALFDRLPNDLADAAIGDFVKLVDTQELYQQTAEIFSRATPAAQRRIIDHLETADATARQMFARALYDKGLDVKIPDTIIPGLRPWER